MPESTVQIARRGFEAVAAGDLAALSAILDPDVQWHGSEGPGPDGCHDRGEALSFIRAARARVAVGELVDVIGAGDHGAAVMRPGRDPEPGESEPRPNPATFRAGRVLRMIPSETPEPAPRAAG